MSLGKILAFTAVGLVVAIGVAAFFKVSEKDHVLHAKQVIHAPIEVELDTPPLASPVKASASIKVLPPAEEIPAPQEPSSRAEVTQEQLPEADRIEELFSTKGPKLPFVETITYKSRVAWQKGRPAWLSDYASHYETSRHFIARSLNGKPDYFKQDLAEGAKFNVYRSEHPIQFQLVVDTSRCKMWLYCIDQITKEKTLLKTYAVSLGRPDSSKTSGLLTPLGKYSLGNRIAIYKPSVMGHYKGEKTEMIKVFGTRWIPFDKEITGCTAPAKGFGIHGVPWVKNSKGTLEQDETSLGKYESDGCIRMASKDVEEVFAITITKPSFIEIVKDFSQSEMAK